MYFKVSKGVFIPRWETAEWTTALAFRLRSLKDTQKEFTVVDLCTGTGCIPIFLERFLEGWKETSDNARDKAPQSTFFAVDINPEAIKVAKENDKYVSYFYMLMQ